MSDTEKHKTFVSTPMEMKNSCSVPGIGPASAEKLGNRGYFLACQLFVQYLQLEEDQFKGWLPGITGQKKEAEQTYKALDEWYSQFGSRDSEKTKVETVAATKKK